MVIFVNFIFLFSEALYLHLIVEHGTDDDERVFINAEKMVYL